MNIQYLYSLICFAMRNHCVDKGFLYTLEEAFTNNIIEQISHFIYSDITSDYIDWKTVNNIKVHFDGRGHNFYVSIPNSNNTIQIDLETFDVNLHMSDSENSFEISQIMTSIISIMRDFKVMEELGY